MIVLIDGIRYRLAAPENEAALEKRIEENYQQIFGEESFYFPKKKIRSKAGIGTIPDAFLMIFDGRPKWCILEVELAIHSVYDHIFPQLTKFRRAIEDVSTRRKIAEFFYESIKADAVLEARFKEQIDSGEVYKAISDMVADRPVIVVAIDEQTEQLDEALKDFGGNVRVVEFKTFRREGISDEINAYVFEPVVARKSKRVAGQETIITQVPIASGSYRRGDLGRAICSLFDERGVDNVTYEECAALARAVKSDTAFDKGHFSWYKNDYRKRQDKK